MSQNIDVNCFFFFNDDSWQEVFEVTAWALFSECVQAVQLLGISMKRNLGDRAIVEFATSKEAESALELNGSCKPVPTCMSKIVVVPGHRWEHAKKIGIGPDFGVPVSPILSSDG